MIKQTQFEDMSQKEQVQCLKKTLDSLAESFRTETKARTMFNKWFRESFKEINAMKKLHHSFTTRLAVFSEIRYMTDGKKEQPIILRGYALAADFDDDWWDNKEDLEMSEWAELLYQIGCEKGFLKACEKYKGREADKYRVSYDDE